MNLDLNKITKKIEQNDFINNFIEELGETLENFKQEKEEKVEKVDNIELTSEEDLEFYRKKWDFLEEFFKEELSDLSKGETFIVTDKYENDYEYHRYKVTQYKDNTEYKRIAFEKDLPENVQLGDVVRKKDGKYIYDSEATQYVNNTINEIKQNIIKQRIT